MIIMSIIIRMLRYLRILPRPEVSSQNTPDIGLDEQKARRTLLLVMGMFVEGKYAELAKLLNEEGITADAIREAADDYPYRLIMPPDVPFADLVHFTGQMRNRTDRAWAVDAKVWTQEEGVSDLVLMMEFIDSPGEYYGVLVEDFHVE